MHYTFLLKLQFLSFKISDLLCGFVEFKFQTFYLLVSFFDFYLLIFDLFKLLSNFRLQIFELIFVLVVFYNNHIYFLLHGVYMKFHLLFTLYVLSALILKLLKVLFIFFVSWWNTTTRINTNFSFLFFISFGFRR